MSSVSPGGRLMPKESSQLAVRPLEDDPTLQSIRTLREVFQSAFGPNGRVHLVHNDSGGHVTATSSSLRLLQCMSISVPILKLVTSAVRGHQALYSDCGNFAALFSLRLIERALTVETNCHRRLIVEVQELLLRTCMDYLQSKECPCETKVDFCNVANINNLVRSVVVSKPGCLLFGADIQHVCMLVLSSFVRTSGHAVRTGPGLGAEAHVLYLCVEGRPVIESKLLDGILFETPQVPTYRKSPLNVRTFKMGHESEPSVVVVLVKVSMAGDSDDFLDVKYESTGMSSDDFDQSVIKQMLQFTETLCARGSIGLLACQKVVHPRVKKCLKEQGVLVLDRFGLVNFTALAQMTGGKVLTSFTKAVTEEDCGHLRTVKHCVIHDRSYIHMQGVQGHGVPVCTMVLCHRSEQAMEELKETCKVAHHVLRMSVSEPLSLMGGGCWYTQLAHHIREQIKLSSEDWSSELGCTRSQIWNIADNFMRCLEEMAVNLDRDEQKEHVMDLATHHHFVMPSGFSVQTVQSLQCQCGAITYANADHMVYRRLATDMLPNDTHGRSTNISEEHYCRDACSVVDGFTPTVAAFRTAVNVANLALSIQHVVTDVN